MTAAMGISRHIAHIYRIFLMLQVLILAGSQRVGADCECGYSSTVGSSGATHVFTDLIESDFTKLGDVSWNTDWRRQAFNVSAKDARGKYGESMNVDNVAVGSGGLALTVRSTTIDGMVSTAEIDTTRLDVLWGTFRAGLKLSSVPGTCAAFFWFYNNTQEIDIEALSSEFDSASNSYPINLVLQTRQAAEVGSDASATGTFQKVTLPFNPTTDIHEYRFDFLPRQVIFYADEQILAEMEGTAVPDHGGHLILQHWSNGNDEWSRGPPTQDAIMTVQYVKAYFNSSTSQRQVDWQRRCTDAAAPGAVCEIPSRRIVGSQASTGSGTPTGTPTGAPIGAAIGSTAGIPSGSPTGSLSGNPTNSATAANFSGPGFFFSAQANMTNNQTVSSDQPPATNQTSSVSSVAGFAPTWNERVATIIASCLLVWLM